MKRILAIDPGLTIGWCYLVVKGLEVVELIVSEHRTEGIAFGSDPMSFLQKAKLDVLVIEDFVGSGPRTKESCYTLKMIGAFEQVGRSRGLEVAIQTNIMRKPWLKDGVKLHRALKSGKYPCHHGKDALAHALRYLKNQGEPWDKKEWWAKGISLG